MEISKFVKKGNILITDAWNGYNYFSNIAAGYLHIVHNHEHGDFEFGDESTSHRENYGPFLNIK